jgi:hypothetical protein
MSLGSAVDTTNSCTDHRSPPCRSYQSGSADGCGELHRLPGGWNYWGQRKTGQELSAIRSTDPCRAQWPVVASRFARPLTSFAWGTGTSSACRSSGFCVFPTVRSCPRAAWASSTPNDSSWCKAHIAITRLSEQAHQERPDRRSEPSHASGGRFVPAALVPHEPVELPPGFRQLPGEKLQPRAADAPRKGVSFRRKREDMVDAESV